MTIFYIDPEYGNDTLNGYPVIAMAGCSINSTVTVTVPNVLGLVANMRVAAVDLNNSGTGIPSTAYISSVGTTTITLNTAATATNANITLIFSAAWKTITPTGTKASVGGDVFRFRASPSPTSVGTATWTNTGKTVVLATPVTANIDTCDVAWQVGNNFITQASDTTIYREGQNSQKFTLSASWTSTGLVAYKTMTTTDFSAYQQISFWIMRAQASVANYLQIKLCSDQFGVTAVNTFNIPAIPLPNVWQPITLDNLSALGSSIQSVALYVVTKQSTTESYWIDNIIACKAPASADSLTLSSLIGKNTTGETFYSIMSINQNTVMLDGVGNTCTPVSSTPALAGYTGITEAVTTYKQETFKTTPTNSTTTGPMNCGKTAQAGNGYLFSGGWDNTTMSTQTGITWLDGSVGDGYCFYNLLTSYSTFSNLSFVRYGDAINMSGGNSLVLSNFNVNNCSGSAVNSANSYSLALTDGIVTNSSTLFTGNNSTNGLIKNIVVSGCSTGMTISQSRYFRLENFAVNSCYGTYNLSILTSSNWVFYNYSTDGHNVGAPMNMLGSSDIYFINPAILENQLFTYATLPQAYTSFASVYFSGYKNSSNQLIFTSLGNISSDTGINRRTQSGMAWKFNILNLAAAQEYFPLTLKVASAVVRANAPVTVNAYMKVESPTMGMKIVCKGGQIAGVSSDVQSYLTTTTGEYQLVSITFTPTEIGVVGIECHVWGSLNSNGWIDDISISQS
jgi:hypothetical protein